MNDAFMSLAQQYMQQRSPQAAAQMLQVITQSGDPQLTMMVADLIASSLLGNSSATSDMTTQPAQPMPGQPMGQNGMRMPMYKKGGKLTAVQKAMQKKKTDRMC